MPCVALPQPAPGAALQSIGGVTLTSSAWVDEEVVVLATGGSRKESRTNTGPVVDFATDLTC